MNVNSNFTNNRKILATIQVLFNRGMVDQTVYIHAMEYYSAMKKNGLLIDATWMKLKNMLSKSSRTQKRQYTHMDCVIHLYISFK